MSFHYRTYFDKDNTIINGSTVNLGANPVTEIYAKGTFENPEFSRYIFSFPIDRLRSFYNQCQLGDLSNVTHTLKLKPIRFFGQGNLSKIADDCLDSSYELKLFRIRQDWVEGCGYDYDCACACNGYINPNCNQSNGASNWFFAKPNERWIEDGIFDTFSGDTIITDDVNFSGEPIYLKSVSQQCDDCLLELDMTDLVNDLISGDTPNYGFGLALDNFYEINVENGVKSVGFYTSETPNFFKPFIETRYVNPIEDDRSSFYLDKVNNLYLYVNLRGEPTNLDENPIVTIYDEFEDEYLTLTGECITKGVYGVSFMVHSSGVTDSSCSVYTDIWSNIIINGVSRPNIEMEFELLPSTDFYQIGLGSYNPKKYGFKYRGIARDEFIRQGDIRKINIDVYEQFKPQRKLKIDGLYYRLYVKEGEEQLDVIPWTPVNQGACDNFIYLYTEWLIPQQYYIDFKAVSNQEERTYANQIKFTILDDEEEC